MSDVKFEPLRSLARNAQRRHMEMQCDPSWVLDVFDERDALRAENVKLAEWYSEAGVREDTLRAEVERLRGALGRISKLAGESECSSTPCSRQQLQFTAIMQQADAAMAAKEEV
jgi:hypothetical protein